MVKLEVWKGRKTFVVRDEKGRIRSYLPQKDSQITISQARERYQQYKTLRPNRVRIKTDIGTKLIKTQPSTEIYTKTQIGRDTVLIRSSQPIPQAQQQERTQITALVTWYGKGESLGYSDMNRSAKDSKAQAFQRARAGAANQEFIGYDWIIEWVNDTQGFAINPQRSEGIHFTVSYQYYSYVKTTIPTQTQRPHQRLQVQTRHRV